ncbi:histone acetyltransferase KAT6B-like [Penaeus japonicus]|uniref:histone acetyltransferase KAT6B-like n=1 Tax=Penaeus japonicus TaxID=27405 RepID=UPI001C70E3EB|nr:histone acetyltransferase KAT6B-like [Penaeus japonicus]
MESRNSGAFTSKLAEQMTQIHKQNFSKEKEEVRTIQRRVEIVHDYFSSEAECCVPSGLSYCDKCDSGPSCCVYLSDEDDSSDPTSSSVDEVGHVNKRAKRDGEGQGEELEYEDEGEKEGEGEEEEEEEGEVIHFYLSGEGMGEGLVEEYVFYVDDDDDENSDDFQVGDEGEVGYYEDEEGRYEEEEEEGEYILDDEEGEYFVDSDEGEWEEEIEEEERQQQKRSRRSRDHFFPRYQEPLEVILEILGEEGEEEENQNDSNDKEEEGGNGDEDLITFSSSSDFSPDSLEEACALKEAKGDVQSPSTEEDLSQQTSDDSPTPQNTSMDDSETIAYTRLPETEDAKEDQQFCIQNLMDEPILENCPQVILPRPSLIKGGEETDREKLRALTSEIEAYLKETTMLLESATTYTSVVTPKATKSRGKGSPDEGGKAEPQKRSDSVAHEPSSVQTTHHFGSDTQSQSSERKIEETVISSSLSTTAHKNLEASHANPPPIMIQSAENPKQTHVTAESCANPSTASVAQQLPKIRLDPPVSGSLEEGSRGLTTSHESQVSEGEHKSLFRSAALDVSHASSTRLTDSPDIYKSLLETHNLAETEYYSAVETSTEVVDALEWEDKKTQKKDKKQPRIIYKPNETTPDSDDCFTSPRNRRTWLAAFEELEDSFDNAIRSGEKRPSRDVSDSGDAENAEKKDASDTGDTKSTDSRPNRRRCESPPPTISCLENLEKLCRRLSLEREKYSEQMCTIDRPSPVGMEDNSYTFSEDDKTFSTSTRADTENDVKSNKPHIVHLPRRSEIRENTGTKIQNLDNIVKGDLNQNKPVYDLTLTGPERAFKENGQLDSFEENEKMTRARWDTKGNLKFQYIDSKLDEIFSSVEDEVSHNTYSTIVKNMVIDHANIKMRSHDDTLYASGKQVQKQLNDILNGMDSMYESYLKKRNSLDFTHESMTFPDTKLPVNEENISHAKTASSHTAAEKKRESKSELDAFRDIIDISEDLKNLCVFHVNKPGWDASDSHSRSPTPREGADAESSFPDFYESDGATPEAEVKEFAPDNKSRESLSPSHVRDPRRRSSKDWEGEAGVGSFLATIKDENLRCYQVTLDYLQKISASQEDTGGRGSTNAHADDVITLPANPGRQTEDKTSPMGSWSTPWAWMREAWAWATSWAAPSASA